MGVNRQYKDSVFTLYMSDPKRLIEVFNALSGTDYPLDTPLEINTLEDALFMERVNDVSFTLDGKLIVLIEHQSTINENMATRMLLYIARLYEKYLAGDAIYREKRIPIPTPRFVVFYNGEKEQPEHSVQKLSDAFMHQMDHVRLDLEVDVYNINYDRDRMPDILKKSESLSEYSAFIYEVRSGMSSGLSFEDAVRNAVHSCISQNIMKNFLEKHGSEVRNMLFTEWDWDRAKEVWQEESRIEGRNEGRKEGRKEGADEEKISFIKSLRGMLAPEEIATAARVPVQRVNEILNG